MEKNKNRKDLLTAGRKKLQQFRKKKDGKGNSSKPSSTRDNSEGYTDEHDATISTSTDAAVAPLPELDSGVDTVASDAASSKSGHGTTAVTTVEAALTHQHGEGRDDDDDDDTQHANDEKVDVGIACILEGAEYPSRGSGMDYTILNQSTDDGHDVDSRVRHLDTSLSLPTDFSYGLEEQVTDVGAMQELGISRGYQIDEGKAKLLDGDGDPPKTDAMKTSGASDSGNVGFHTEGTQTSSGFVDVETSSEFENNDNAESLACKQINLSSILDGSLVKLSQLAEILQVLEEDEFGFLFMSRESSLETSSGADKTKANDCVVRDAVERLKEHLYVSSLSKDSFHLQLSEHQKWFNEICAVNSSLVLENEKFAREIVQRRDELQKVVSERAELEKQLQLSKAEDEVFAAKVNELESKLEIKQGEMASMFSELVDCRNLVNALQSENQSLNKGLKVIKYDTSEEHNDQIQEANIKLMVLYEALRELSCEAVAHESELLGLNNALQKQESILKSENNHLREKMNDLQAQINELQGVPSVGFHRGPNDKRLSLSASLEMQVHDLRSQLQEKVSELEQSEQRVSFLREKLSIAFTKGKALISRRESLKQSLADMSKEVEKCSQELLSKDSKLHELEAKVKVYCGGAERMEALQSELSYIRNSATVLRESFLLKDSALHRIEEILEDLELPEHVHSGDITEKIDWLAQIVRSHRSSDMQPNPTSAEDLRIRYEELQNSFYGLAEQNEMLEQSLMERNNLVQRWEETLDIVDMPSELRSMEPEDKIQYLGSALTDAQDHFYSLRKKIDYLENFCGSLTADLEDSQTRTSELDTAFQKVREEKEILSKDLEILKQDNDEHLKRIADFACSNQNLQKEANMLQAEKLCLVEDIGCIKDAVRRLQEMVEDALQDSCPEDMVLGKGGIEIFEEMLRKLVEKYKTLPSAKPADVDSKDVELTLSKKLEESMGEIVLLKEEKDRHVLTNELLLHELEELKLEKRESEELFNQEEHKSASLREKLNIAVRKGKSLVQKRDDMKQMIEELNGEVERLKSERKHTEKTMYEYEEQIKNLFSAHDKVQVMESENSFLRDRLAESKRYLQEKEGSWSTILNALGEIDAGLVINSGDPVEWIREIGNYLHDLHGRLDNFEQESRKSKRAAELLLAELNEVQERNDGLQDDLAKAVHELAEVSREKDLAEKSKYEALAHVEELSHLQSEEKDKHISEIMVLKSGVDSMRNDIFAIERELGDVLSKDLEVLYNVKVIMTSFFDADSTPALDALFPDSFLGGISSTKSENKVYVPQIDSLRERIHKHSHLLQEETSRLSEVVVNARMEYTSQKELYESVKRQVERLQSIEKDRQSELHILQGKNKLFYETCASAISNLENWKEHVIENVLASGAPQGNLNYQNKFGVNNLTGDVDIFNEESIRSICDKLLLVVEDSISMHTNELARVMEVGQSEMKSTITNLQKELQEKETERDRISNEFANQIKEAVTTAKNYLLDLQQARVQLDVMAEEHKLLEQRMKELQDQETNSIDLQQKVNSLTDALAAKVQECEGLMQALDEQEAEMENLVNKIVELEKVLQQKNEDSENLEASRAKALKKLSVTVSKFDELHSLSKNLLSEVEKLQSQLKEKDGEISFLRQEVTRCTNDALAVAQKSKMSSDGIQDLLAWLDSLISRAQVHDVAFDSSKTHLINEYKEALQKKILDLISELENLRETTQNRDMLFQELAEKEQHLKNSLREMESKLVLQGVGDSAKATKSTSEVVEVEPTADNWASAGPIAPQVPSLRKSNNDQVAIAIDMEYSGHKLEDDDDKAHGFKSLTTSKMVPRFTRPVSDMVDGLWVSCDRALMRKPALRVGLMMYWAMLHTMLAAFVV